MSYLARLTVELAARIGALPAETRTRHSAWLCSAQQADGGFAGRSGQSDVYYTSFGLRAMLLLGVLDEARAQAAARFLANWLKGRISGENGEPEERPQADLPADTLCLSMPELASLVFSAVVIEAVLGSRLESIWGKQDFRRLVVSRAAPITRCWACFAAGSWSCRSTTPKPWARWCSPAAGRTGDSRKALRHAKAVPIPRLRQLRCCACWTRWTLRPLGRPQVFCSTCKLPRAAGGPMGAFRWPIC